MKTIKIVILVILACLMFIPGVACFESESATWVKVLNALNMFFEALVLFCLARLDWKGDGYDGGR